MCDFTKAAEMRGLRLASIAAAFLSALPGAAWAGHWKPPIGIPAPSFGIEESVDDNTYTHWVDNSGSCSDSGNGTPASPRCTIPTTLAAGSIVQVRGGPYWSNSQTRENRHRTRWTHNGTSANPVVVRGPTGQFIDLGRADIEHVGTYAIIENLKAQRWTITGGATSHHLVLRHCQILDHPGTGGAVVMARNVSNIVIYDCEVARNGVIPSSADHHGINVAGRGIRDVWILDNHIHENSGDGIQFCHGCIGGSNDGPANVYIGRNVIHHDEENGLDIKETLGPVVVSQNIIYGYKPGVFSGNGDAIRVNDEGAQGEIWVLYNEIYDAVMGIDASGGATGTVYIIGNEIHDVNAAIPSGSFAVLNNTIINVTHGILGGEAKNNIVRARSTAIGSRAAKRRRPRRVPGVGGCSHNLVQEGSIVWSCTDGLSGDPKLVMSGSHATGLQPDSPAIDSGFANHQAYATFESSYGLSIRFDRNGVARPQGAGWDIGAYEFGGSPGGGPGARPRTW